MKYNLIIVSDKVVNEYLNLTKEKFFDKLWEWCWVDDLYDILKEDKPSTKDLLDYLSSIFWWEYLLHRYEDDEVTAYAFVVDEDKVRPYLYDNDLEDYIINKLKEKNLI